MTQDEKRWSKESVRSAIDMIAALAETIRELGEVPSGVLYANVMGRMTLESYEGCLRVLKGARLVAERANVLRWIGPRF